MPTGFRRHSRQMSNPDLSLIWSAGVTYIYIKYCVIKNIFVTQKAQLLINHTSQKSRWWGTREKHKSLGNGLLLSMQRDQ